MLRTDGLALSIQCPTSATRSDTLSSSTTTTLQGFLQVLGELLGNGCSGALGTIRQDQGRIGVPGVEPRAGCGNTVRRFDQPLEAFGDKAVLIGAALRHPAAIGQPAFKRNFESRRVDPGLSAADQFHALGLLFWFAG